MIILHGYIVRTLLLHELQVCNKAAPQRPRRQQSATSCIWLFFVILTVLFLFYFRSWLTVVWRGLKSLLSWLLSSLLSFSTQPRFCPARWDL